MLEFIKMFGMGIVYTILSPVILLFFLIFLVYSFVNYLVCEVINLSGFFLGRKFSEKTKIDKEYARIKAEKNNVVFHEEHNNIINENINNEGGDFNV